MLSGSLLVDEAAVTALVPAWDELAVTAGEPYCAPAWMLSWWRHAAPADARLRVAVARDEGRVVGVAPFYAERRLGLEWLRPLAAPVCHRVGPICVPAHEETVAPKLAELLASARPRPALLTFDGLPGESPWPRLLAAAWPRRTLRHQRPQRGAAPSIDLRGRAYPAWLAARSANFRNQTRRTRRKLEAAGARFHRLDGEAVLAALEDFARLHHGRWAWRGGSRALTEGVEDMVRDAASVLAAQRRLWLWAIEAEGTTISLHMFVGAGANAIYWLGGHDDRWNAYRPGLQALVAAVEDAFASGIERLDLGPGAQGYKLRLTDEAQVLEFVSLAPAGASLPLALGVIAAGDARSAAGAVRRRLRARARPA